jgi:hypothetical protein
MKFPRVRFTVRRLMVLVILAGVGIGGYVLLRRSAEYRHRTEAYASDVDFIEQQIRHDCAFIEEYQALSELRKKKQTDAPSVEGFRSDEDFIAFYLKSIEGERRYRDRFRQMQRTYERAARYPFLPVAPDPPEPE